jgi:hypothetical protein
MEDPVIDNMAQLERSMMMITVCFAYHDSLGSYSGQEHPHRPRNIQPSHEHWRGSISMG